MGGSLKLTERPEKQRAVALISTEPQRPLDEKGLTVKKGVVQDATSITSDPGHVKKDKPRGGEARTRRSRDGTWVKKGSKSSFGFRLHAKSDTDHGLIRDLETTTASVHDSQVDLSRKGEVVYLQGLPWRGDPWFLGGDEAWGAGSSLGYPGPAQECPDQPEAGSRRETLRGEQADVQRGSRVGDIVTQGQGEDGVRVSVL